LLCCVLCFVVLCYVVLWFVVLTTAALPGPPTERGWAGNWQQSLFLTNKSTGDIFMR
jgi:hypothetical protein